MCIRDRDVSEAISYELRYRNLEAIEWNLLLTNESEYQLQGLEPCVDYEVELEQGDSEIEVRLTSDGSIICEQEEEED